MYNIVQCREGISPKIWIPRNCHPPSPSLTARWVDKWALWHALVTTITKPQSSTSWRSSPELLRFDGSIIDEGSWGLYKDGDTLCASSPRGLVAFIIEGLLASLRLPLHDAARRDGGGTKKLLSLAIGPVLLCTILSTLGNRCRLVDDEVDVLCEENESSLYEEGGLSLLTVVSRMLSPGFSTVCSTAKTGEGIKKVGLEPPPGLTAAIAGDGNKFDGLPPPLLNVSTYLKKLQSVLHTYSERSWKKLTKYIS
jgi:hypothetical protein